MQTSPLFTSDEEKRHDAFRHEEYSQFEWQPGVYADWAGSALTPQSLLQAQQKLLSRQVLGNPHSNHRPSNIAKTLVDRTRARILAELGAPEDMYDVIFTANATAAILLLNHIKWQCSSQLLMLSDNHNSVNGLRKIAGANGARWGYNYIQKDLTINTPSLLADLTAGAPTWGGLGIFAYPFKSNYSGVVHSIGWADKAQALGWKVLLDVSSYLPNHRLSLKELDVYPDFLPMSFYKIFGFPAGVGALVVKKSALEIMDKRWFSGGSIMIVSVGRDFYVPETDGHGRYEDGTLPFMSIPVIEAGFDFLNQAREQFPDRAHKLAVELHRRLSSITPAGKRRLVIHTPANRVSDTVSFNVYEEDTLMDPGSIEEMASKQDIWFRSGCLCNPGCNEVLFGYTTERAEREIYEGRVTPQRWEDINQLIAPTSLGTLRVSFGLPNIEADVDRIAKFFEGFVAG